MITPEEITRVLDKNAGRARFRKVFNSEPEVWLRKMIDSGKQTPSEAKRNLKRVLDRLATVELESQAPPYSGAAPRA